MRERVEEILEKVWILREDGKNKIDEFEEREIEAVKDFIEVKGEKINLKEKGKKIARRIVRRHRLAERLFVDVFEMVRVHEDACKFEHIVSQEVEEAICTLLGHPKECPHGKEIPFGKCCEKHKRVFESVIVPIPELAPGESGKIAYILTKKHKRLHRLFSFGIVPGTEVLVHQKHPSFIIQVDETQIALEKKIAEEIYVKR
ncbi:MAG: metal-dependent transcriptional regulator [Candidatus Methanofastidiosia archaeon]